MSGVKKATVTNSLNKTLNTVRKAVEDCAERAGRVGNTGRKDLDRKRAEAEKIEVNRVLPPELKKFLAGETAQWEELLRRHDKALKDAGGLYQDASDKLQEYETRKSQSNREIDSIQNQANSIRYSVRGKDWYCDEEYKRAKKLRDDAEGVVGRMESNLSLAVDAQGLSQKSFAKYTETENVAGLAQQEYDRLVNLGNDRKEKERIREENERNAKLLADDLRSLKQRIESKDYRKFGDGAYSAGEQKLIDTVESLVAGGQYEQALKTAGGLKAKLAAAAEKIENAQLAWEAAKARAEKTLADANEEIAGINRGEIATYSGMDAGEVQAAFDEVDAAANAINAEDFAGAEAAIRQGMQKIRAIAEKTLKNKEDAERRLEIAQCVMQALYDSNYDEPQAYLEDDNNQLSDLHIVATAPGNVADMEMQVALNGEVSFEVKNIPAGQEHRCTGAIAALQEKLGEEGIDFGVTHWGRAEGMPDPGAHARQIVQQKTKTREPKTRMGSI